MIQLQASNHISQKMADRDHSLLTLLNYDSDSNMDTKEFEVDLSNKIERQSQEQAVLTKMI